MRIIDKNTDFYDYLQNIYPDKSITFDRTSSFILSKEIMCDSLQRLNRDSTRHQFFLLQVCNTFWLFLITVTGETKTHDQTIMGWSTPIDYEIELLATWKNYNKERTLISAAVVIFKWSVFYALSYKRGWSYSKDSIVKSALVLKQAIDNNEYEVFRRINKHVVRNGDGTESIKTIPIFKACGAADYIDPIEIYLALEEYFSLEKQANERSESIGLTDKERIENHGFCTKTSFRGGRRKQ